MEELTPKQQKVIRLIAKGLTNGQIAERMGISLAGAKWHVGEVLSKYGVDSREEAVRVWKRKRTIGARLGRMTGAFGLPKVLAGAATVASIAALVIVAVVVGRGGDGETSSSLDPGRDRGEPVAAEDGTVIFPQYYADTTVRQVTVASAFGTRAAMNDQWASFDEDGEATLLGYRTYDESGDLRSAFVTVPGETTTTIDPDSRECSTSGASTPDSPWLQTFLPRHIDEGALAAEGWELVDDDVERLWEVTGTWLASPHEAAAERFEPNASETIAWQHMDGSFLYALLADRETGLIVVWSMAGARDDMVAGGGTQLLLVETFTRDQGEAIIGQWADELCDERAR